MSTIYVLTSLVAVMIIGIFAHMLGRVVKIPSIVFLLIAGIILGPEVTGVIEPSRFGSGIELLVGFAVAIIVFDGGLDSDIRQLRKMQRSIVIWFRQLPSGQNHLRWMLWSDRQGPGRKGC